MANSVLWVKCRKWIHGRCAKVKGQALRLGRDFLCVRCMKQADGFRESVEELCEDVETVRDFCFLGDRVKFTECGELLNSKRFLLKLKGMVYQRCVRLAMLYGSETWCLRENEMDLLRRTQRAMCGAKLVEKKRTEHLMEMLGLKETAVQMTKANGVRWYAHVLRRDAGHVLRKALEFEVRGKRKPGQPKKMRKMQVEKESKSIG